MVKTNFKLWLAIKCGGFFVPKIECEKKVRKGLESQRKICIFVEILGGLVVSLLYEQIRNQTILIYKTFLQW